MAFRQGACGRYSIAQGRRISLLRVLDRQATQEIEKHNGFCLIGQPKPHRSIQVLHSTWRKDGGRRKGFNLQEKGR